MQRFQLSPSEAPYCLSVISKLLIQEMQFSRVWIVFAWLGFLDIIISIEVSKTRDIGSS